MAVAVYAVPDVAVAEKVALLQVSAVTDADVVVVVSSSLHEKSSTTKSKQLKEQYFVSGLMIIDFDTNIYIYIYIILNKRLKEGKISPPFN